MRWDGGWNISGLFRLVSWQCQWAAGRVGLSLSLPLIAGGLLTLHGVDLCLVAELLKLTRRLQDELSQALLDKILGRSGPVAEGSPGDHSGGLDLQIFRFVMFQLSLLSIILRTLWLTCMRLAKPR